MMKPKRITLSDVAEKAGVSRTAAAYILSKTRGGFAKETVEKVTNAARELGFRPNPIARSLRTGKSGLFGLVSYVDSEAFNHVVNYQMEAGIALEAAKHAKDIVKILTSDDEKRSLARLEDLIETKLLEGVILQSPAKGSNTIPLLQSVAAVFVVIGNPGYPDVYSVDTDNVRVGRITTQHLIDLGHRRLAYIAPGDSYAYGNDRVEGFLLACKEAGLSEENALVIRDDDSMAGGYRAMHELLQVTPTVTGVCAVDDAMAYGAVKAIDEAGLSVPNDISVVGCNNDFFMATDPDFLTTVNLNFVEMGSAAARKLFALIGHQSVPVRDLVLDIHLICRKSSAAPRSK